MVTNKLAHLVVKVSKEDSSFTYFTLEAHDGMCFYSTLPHENGDQFRVIDIKATLEFEPNLIHTLKQLSRSFNVEILSHEIIED